MQKNNTDTEVRMKTGKKTLKILKGKEAEVALKAMEYVMDNVKGPKKIKIDIIVPGVPKNFSYANALLEALDCGLKNPVEIADYILKKLEKVKKPLNSSFFIQKQNSSKAVLNF